MRVGPRNFNSFHSQLQSEVESLQDAHVQVRGMREEILKLHGPPKVQQPRIPYKVASRSAVQDTLEATDQVLCGQAGALIEAHRAAEAEEAIAEVRAQRLALEEAAAKRGFGHRGLGEALHRRGVSFGVEDPRAVRTNPAWMAQSATFKDSNALRWAMDTPRKSLTVAGAASVTAGVLPTPRTIQKSVNGYRNQQWPGPAGW
mmetsp:Transcript_103404/g.287959  ORF Transcript_103404/g.287959 Transcript_103404/m.287959 type:complete len:202 (+) Transcript_103404:63-668(+)